jgi:hypothetical protein
VLADTVTVAALAATVETVAVMPVGALPAVVPAAEVYHIIVPTVPDKTLVVVAAKVTLPAVPAVNAPLWAPSVTVSVPAPPPEELAGLLHPRTNTLTTMSVALRLRNARTFIDFAFLIDMRRSFLKGICCYSVCIPFKPWMSG